MIMASEKTIVCTKDGKWFTKTPKPGMRDALKARLLSDGYIIRKEVKAPSVRTLENWSMDGVAKTLMGGTIEPDGMDSEGCPSWLLHLGYI
jgi:hypothetical protein